MDKKDQLTQFCDTFKKIMMLYMDAASGLLVCELINKSHNNYQAIQQDNLDTQLYDLYRNKDLTLVETVDQQFSINNNFKEKQELDHATFVSFELATFTLVTYAMRQLRKTFEFYQQF